MKKFLVILLAALMVISMAACKKVSTEPLADSNHAAWVALGNHMLADGETVNGWGDKDTELFEKSTMKAISLAELKELDKDLYETLSKKDVKYLYTIDLVFGVNDANWTCKYFKDGKMYLANGSYAFKVGQCNVDADGENKVYAVDQWISDPKTAYAESLTPDTLFMPVWQEEKDENGFSWADNPVVTGGAGLYTLVVAQYGNASAAGKPGYGIALILKEAKEGIAYEEIVPYVAADHTYGIVGSFEGSNWGEGADIAMAAAGDNAWSGEVELKAGDQFKVRADSDWTNNWGDAASEDGNFHCEEDGTYVVTITFDGGNGTVTVTKK